MATPTTPSSVVVDSNVLIALCAREIGKYPEARQQMSQYAEMRCALYAPGVIVAESLYVLCGKLENGTLSKDEHATAVTVLASQMRYILPPPSGDGALIARAEAIREGYGCSRSADSLYIALAELLSASGTVEIVTFDAALKRQVAATTPSVGVRD